MDTSFQDLKVEDRRPGRQPVLRQVGALDEQTFWSRTPRANTDLCTFSDEISGEIGVVKNENQN